MPQVATDVTSPRSSSNARSRKPGSGYMRSHCLPPRYNHPFHTSRSGDWLERKHHPLGEQSNRAKDLFVREVAAELGHVDDVRDRKEVDYLTQLLHHLRGGAKFRGSSGLHGLDDVVVLALVARGGSLLVSHDRRTMPR